MISIFTHKSQNIYKIEFSPHIRFFPEFGSCWGGATFSPAAEAAVSGRQTEEQRGYSHTYGHRTSQRLVRLRPSGGAVTHWKPKLNAISEDSPMKDVDRGGVNRRTAGFDDKKRPVKVRPKAPARAANHADDYWQSSQAMALPAFSPMSFLF